MRYDEFLNVRRGHAEFLDVGWIEYARCGQRLIEAWPFRWLLIQIQCFGSFAGILWLGRVLCTFVLIKWRVHILITIVVHFHNYCVCFNFFALDDGTAVIALTCPLHPGNVQFSPPEKCRRFFAKFIQLAIVCKKKNRNKTIRFHYSTFLRSLLLMCAIHFFSCRR